MELLPVLDLLSTLVFALVGARIAADKGLDYGGIAFIAAVASVSGGTLRNVFLGLKPVWISDPWITVMVLSAVLITLVFRRVTRIGKTLLVMDTFGLAIATISGSYLAFKQEAWGLERVYQLDIEQFHKQPKNTHDLPHEHLGDNRIRGEATWSSWTFSEVLQYFTKRTKIVFQPPVKHPEVYELRG